MTSWADSVSTLQSLIQQVEILLHATERSNGGWDIDSLPIINLPHRWDESDALIPESSPAPCPRCKWNGDPSDLGGPKSSLTRWDLYNLEEKDFQAGPSECACCEILRLSFCQAVQAGQNKKHAVLFDILDSLYNIFRGDIDGGQKPWRHLFISDGSQLSTINKYNFTTRRMLSTGVQWASDLISKCMSSHNDCQSQTEGAFLPTRLIHIQRNKDDDNPRLKLQNSQAVLPGSRYVALSYCWGGYEPACMTTNATLSANSELIQWNKLPRTFQDAVNFTLDLGIDFLWIDSVCIIQNDRQDWNQEAPRMNAVYKNSYVTLAALCGRDSTNGLRIFSMEETSSPLVQLRTAQSTHVLYTRPCHYLDTGIGDSGSKASRYCSYPLLSRAWTYQERIVSTRVIFFTESEMIYQCQCHVACECGASEDYYCDASRLSLLDKSTIRSMTLNYAGASLSVADIWREKIVFTYSSLDLSDPRDKLPAVGAIAEQFQGVRPGERYLAGLWSDTLLVDLMWYCTGNYIQGFSDKQKLNRLNGVPTWTWASLPNQVGYLLYGDLERKKFHHKARFKAYCCYTDNKTFGTLESSQLVLSGRVLACMLERPKKENHLRPRLSYKNESVWMEITNCGRDKSDDSRYSTLVNISVDQDENGFQWQPPRQPVQIMEIFMTKDSNRGIRTNEWAFLLLRPEAETQGGTPDNLKVFTRGGIVTIAEQEPDDPSVRSTWFETVMEEHSRLATYEIR